MLTIEEIKGKVTPVLRAAGARKAALFGSYARGEETPESDVDILVQMPEGASLFDVGGLKVDLEDALKKEVDLVQYDAIKPRIKSYIMADLVSIL